MRDASNSKSKKSRKSDSSALGKPAWAKEKVREHVKSLGGTHFDPKIVELFLKFDVETKEKSNNEQ